MATKELPLPGHTSADLYWDSRRFVETGTVIVDVLGLAPHVFKEPTLMALLDEARKQAAPGYELHCLQVRVTMECVEEA